MPTRLFQPQPPAQLVLFGFAAIARWTGGALVTGAYFAGLAISRFPVGGLARGYLRSFSDFFTTIFYVALGLLITVPSPRQVITELVFVAVILLLGCGETGSRVLAGLRPTSTDVVVIEGDPAVVERLARKGVTVLRGDAADPKVLREAQADRALAVVSTMRRADDNARVLSTASGPAVFVRVFSEQEAERVRAFGGHPVVEAELAAEALLNWHSAVLSGETAVGAAR